LKNSGISRGIDLRSETLLQVFKKYIEDFEAMKQAGLRSYKPDI